MGGVEGRLGAGGDVDPVVGGRRGRDESFFCYSVVILRRCLCAGHGARPKCHVRFSFFPSCGPTLLLGGSLLHRLAGLRSGGIRILQRFVFATTTYTNGHWGHQRGVFRGLIEARGGLCSTPVPPGAFFFFFLR